MLMVDELYSLLSMLLHLWVSIKETLNQSDECDTIKLTEWVLSIDQEYGENYLETRRFFEKCTPLAEF